jgi:ABC-2 type transport system permease protein
MKRSTQKIFSSKFGWLLLLIFLFAVNFIASRFHYRVDLTKEKRYTLTKGTRDLLQNADDQIQVDVFLKGKFPSKFRKLTNSVEEFLGLMKEAGGADFTYRLISPSDNLPGVTGVTYADSLQRMGAMPINLKAQVETGESSSYAYPYAIMKYKGREKLITLFTVPPLFNNQGSPEKVINNAEAKLEYQFVSALDALVQTNLPMVGYSIGNGEPAIGSVVIGGTPQYLDPRTADLEYTIRSSYQLYTLDLNTQPFIPDTFKVVVFVKPSLRFTDEEKLKIDQYVMRGGKLLMFIDNLIAEQDSLQYKPETIAYDRNLNLTDLLFRYGTRINTDLVMDLKCDYLPFAIGGTPDNPQFEFLKWNYYPLFESKGNSTINKNLGLVAGRFVNSMDTIGAPGVSKTVLLSSSPNSRTISTPALISLNENRNLPEDAKFNKNAIPVAMLLEGKFTSLFRNRLTKAQADTLAAYRVPFFESSPNDNKIIVVADGDLVLNAVSPQDGPLQMGMNKYTIGSQFEYQFANKEFLQNCLEYLINNPAIIQTRNKDIVLRLLDSQAVNEQKTTWQFLNIGLPILLIIIFGWVYQAVRRRKYVR